MSLRNLSVVSTNINEVTLPKVNTTLDDVRSVIKDVKDVLPLIRVTFILLIVLLGIVIISTIVSLVLKVRRKPEVISSEGVSPPLTPKVGVIIPTNPLLGSSRLG